MPCGMLPYAELVTAARASRHAEGWLTREPVMGGGIHSRMCEKIAGNKNSPSEFSVLFGGRQKPGVTFFL